MRDFTEAVANYRYSEVIAVTGSQVAKTDGVVLNTVGWRMMDNPTPTLIFMPTEKLAQSLSKDRLAKMFGSVPALQKAINKRTKSIYEMFINGVRLGLGWGGSATEVASHPAGLVCFDELDRIADIPGEGSAWELSKVRGSTYPNFTMVGTSTPTLGKVDDERHAETGLIHWRISDHVQSLSWSLWQDGTRHEFMLQCPECIAWFAPKLKLLWWPEKATPRQAEREAALRCPHCAGLIAQQHQHYMVQNGLMIAPGQWVEEHKVQGNPPDSSIYSGHVNGLCSPWVSWGKRASDLVRAQQSGQSGRIQAVINTRFGELYSESGDAPDWQAAGRLRRSSYRRGEIPCAVGELTLACDVQKSRLVWSLMGWSLNGNELEAWLIDYGEIHGSTAQPEVFEELRLLVEQSYGELAVKQAVIDTGYNPSKALTPDSEGEKHRNILYEFCRSNPRFLAAKSSSVAMSKPFTRNLIDLDFRGKQRKTGLGLWTVDPDYYKLEVYSRLARSLEQDRAGALLNKPGVWHLPADTDDDYLRQLTAEERVLNERGKPEWIRNYRENHFLDCAMLHCFLADKLRLRLSLRPAAAPAMPANIPQAKAEALRKIQAQPWYSGGGGWDSGDDYAGVGSGEWI